MTASAATFPPLLVTPPAGGFDRAAARDLVKESGLATALHKLVRAPFGHTVLSLRALDAAIEAADLALQAGDALHAALLEDIARAGSLALPEPTRDQRMFVGEQQDRGAARVHVVEQRTGAGTGLRKQRGLTATSRDRAGAFRGVRRRRALGLGVGHRSTSSKVRQA